MYTVYIVFSQKIQKYYSGFSQNKDKRILQHRKEKSHWTSRADDWVLLWEETCKTSSEARKLEIKIKKRGARRFIEDMSRPR